MEWMNRAGRPAQTPAHNTVPGGHAPASAAPQNGGKKKKEKGFTFQGVSTVVLAVAVMFLTLAVIGATVLQKRSNENQYLATDKMQAVFLNGGQVYFGKIRALNSRYVGLADIYYLRVNQQVQPKDGEQAQQDISLVKLGCELHGPQDQMLINRDQVVFWENLKDDGQVAKAVAEYKKANPDGQKCETTQQQSNQQQTTENKNQ